MSKIIEVDFLPRETNQDFPLDFPWLNSFSDSAFGSKRRILIVDNDPNTTHLVKILLEKTGHYQVFEENESARAHQSAKSFQPDLILLDIVMPETHADGAEIATRIQADSELQSAPIIFLTGLVTRAESKTDLRIDGRPCLAKPINVEELIEAIDKNVPARARAFG
jgi:CheY-like chemotaxis protein